MSVEQLPRIAYTREQAAEACGVSLDTIRRAIQCGDLRAKRVRTPRPGETAAERAKRAKEGGGKIIIPADSLREWLANLEDA